MTSLRNWFAFGVFVVGQRLVLLYANKQYRLSMQELHKDPFSVYSTIAHQLNVLSAMSLWIKVVQFLGEDENESKESN